MTDDYVLPPDPWQYALPWLHATAVPVSKDPDCMHETCKGHFPSPINGVTFLFCKCECHG